MRFGITVHAIIKNEEQWVWYALQSVINYVVKIIVYDTGSKDSTIEVIKSIKSDKILFSEKSRVTPGELVQLRNDQIRQTETDWFMLLDGDEVWSEAGMNEASTKIKSASKNITAFVSKTLIPLGDLFHYQSESAGRYRLLGRTGHFNLRGYRKKGGYRWIGRYPLETYVDGKGIPIQEKSKNLVMLEYPYWHLTHLKRSNKDIHRKLKLEIGEKRKILLPEVFFKTRPNIIPSPWTSFTQKEKVYSYFFTPLVKLKRKLLT